MDRTKDVQEMVRDIQKSEEVRRSSEAAGQGRNSMLIRGEAEASSMFRWEQQVKEYAAC